MGFEGNFKEELALEELLQQEGNRKTLVKDLNVLYLGNKSGFGNNLKRESLYFVFQDCY